MFEEVRIWIHSLPSMANVRSNFGFLVHAASLADTVYYHARNKQDAADNQRHVGFKPCQSGDNQSQSSQQYND